MKTTTLHAGPSRRLLLGSALAAPFVRVGPARAAEFNYKLATGQSLTQLINARLEQACGRIREATSGRVDVRFFPASQLGSDTDLLSQVRSGGVEFLNIAGSVLSTVASGAAITNVGFAFSSYDEVWPGMDGSLGADVRTQIEKTGFIVASKPGDNGFRQITSSAKPIKTPDDLKGYRSGTGLADLHVPVQVTRRQSDLDQLQRTLHGAANAPGRRTGERPRHHRGREAL